MKKQPYKKIEVAVIALAKEDVICVSGGKQTYNELIPDWD